ncbi:MAG: extracellular solute-binding protein [Oscillospiraceae bacterium]|jgi:putative aldouronate transport system substrate-binding protein|nr:extracellular solute-binding protein [Oscillospiraceae bacterium]
MKKILALTLALLMCIALIAACNDNDDTPVLPTPSPTPSATPTVPDDPPETDPTRFDELGLEIDANGNVRFIEQRSIRVLTWDRSDNEDPNTAFTAYLAEKMLEYHNVVVEFVDSPRWGEDENILLLLTEQIAPDVCVTYNYGAVNEFARQGAVTDLAPLLAGSGDIFPHLWDWLGAGRLYANMDRETGEIYSFMSRMPFNQRYIPFVREDWVAALGKDLPTSIDEFEALLYAFKDNAEELLGSDANQMIPLHMTSDPGWVAGQMITSFIPDDITDKDLYVYGWGAERNFFYPGIKEAIRYLNKWFNDGLIHPDFALFGTGDDTPDNLIKAGFVGAIASHSFDQPYRGDADGWQGQIQEQFGEDAGYIAVDTFKNDAGIYRKLLGPGNDRTLFIPSINTDPVAALMYFDFLCRVETRFMLQIGFEGINYEKIDGAFVGIPVADDTDPFHMRSGRNHDIAITTHSGGLTLQPLVTTEEEGLTFALASPFIAPRLIERARSVQASGNRENHTGNIGEITAEQGITNLGDMGNAVFVRAIAASVADFDAVYDREMDELLERFGNAVIEERRATWESVFGDAVMLPDNR